MKCAPYFLRAVQLSFDLLRMALLVLKNECQFLETLSCLISKRKKTYIWDIWSDQVSCRTNNKSFSFLPQAFEMLVQLGLNRRNAKIDKLKTTKSNFIITKQEVVSIVFFFNIHIYTHIIKFSLNTCSHLTHTIKQNEYDCLYFAISWGFVSLVKQSQSLWCFPWCDQTNLESG